MSWLFGIGANMASYEVYFRELWAGRRSRLRDRLFISFLTLLSIPYTIAMRVRVTLYFLGILKSHRLGKPVISVGNLSVGGTGKTPMTALLARMLISRGLRVAVLSRGYGGVGEGEIRIVSDGRRTLVTAEESGDEPYLLATTIPGLIVVIGADRFRAGMEAVHRFDPDIFILDDGFQHLQLHRDLNILLLDGRKPFGNGRVLPAGLLREPRSAVRRADFIVLTRSEMSGTTVSLAEIPFCNAYHRLVGFVPLGGSDTEPLALLAGRRGIAFAGIAEPEIFFAALRSEGLELVETVAFRDHCRYLDGEVELLSRLCVSTGADYLITTEKDAVKLISHRDMPESVYAVRLEIEVRDFDILREKVEKLL